MQLLFRRRLLSPLRRQHARAAYTSGASGGRGAGGHSSGSSESGGESGREGSVVPPPLRRTLSNVDHNAGNGAGNGSDFQQTKHDMRWLLESIGGQREVSYWLEHYASEEGSDQPFAVIKVGGGVVEDDRQLNDLCSSLAFLKRSGLNPIVIHGAGPQLNADLESQGIVSDYIEGIRVTTPEILRTARRVFLDVNRRLVDALEERGTRARFIDPSLFEADLVDREQYGLVGEINKVQTEWISDATRSGYLPVVCSLAESSLGQTLNVNADVAAVRLAEAVMPMKMIYINTMGGLLDGDDNLIRNINYPSDFEWLLEQPWLRHGTKLKTVEINELLDILPASSSVSVTSPENLMRELFTHKGCGTLCRKETKVHCLDSMETIDLERLKALLKRSFKGRSPVQGYVEGLHKDLHRIYITDDYEGAIILTKEDGIATPYMDKFAVSKLMQGTGTGKALWAQVVADEPKLWWRSRKGNPVNHWYHEIASTLANDIAENWRLYAYGYDLANTADTEELRLCATAARAMPPTIMPPSEDDDSEDDVSDGEEVAQSGGAGGGGGGGGGGGSAFASTAAALGPATAAGYSPPPLAPSNTRFFQSSSSCSSSGDKVYNAGLIGARGYVGAELIRLIGDHPSLHLSVASSRALEGQRISEVVEKQRVYGGASSWESAPKGGLDPEARFTNISADDAAAMSDEVDVWFLALPNGLAQPFVGSLVDNAASDKVPVIVDLSADHRFVCGVPEVSGANAGKAIADQSQHRWTYGFPERYREELAEGRRSGKPSLVANPGCYATGATSALLPLVKGMGFALKDDSVPSVFGVSGYSGAGTTPSDKNDPEKLNGNLMAYGLVDHIHEREVGSQLGRPIFFMPHVGPHFRGISLTVSVELDRPCTDAAELEAQFRRFYAGDALICVSADAPQVSANAGGHHVCIGGFSVSADGRHAVIHVTIDNLLKGAATQALQNANLCLGLDEMEGIHIPEEQGWELNGGALTARAHAAAVMSQ